MTNIFITFSENIDPATAVNQENYLVSVDGAPFGGNNGFPMLVEMVGQNGVVLHVDPMTQGQLYTVTANNVYDLCIKNTLGIDEQISFHAWQADAIRGDVRGLQDDRWRAGVGSDGQRDVPG